MGRRGAAPGAARLRREFAFDLIHAHYAVPAGDAARRACPEVPLVVSVHGGDVLGSHAGHANVAATLRHARIVLANSAGTGPPLRGARSPVDPGRAPRRRSGHGRRLPRPRRAGEHRHGPTLVTVGNLIARKRHALVIAALAQLAPRHPGLRYEIVGDGPERAALLAQARRLGVADRVVMHGARSHADARGHRPAGHPVRHAQRR